MHLYLDCFSGISGDMFLGALCDLGLDFTAFQKELTKLACHDEFRISLSRVKRQGIDSAKLDVELVHNHHDHSHSHHGRHLSDIKKLIETSKLKESVRTRAIRIFQRIGEAEAKIHGVPLEKIHFHEVGAIDSIVDIVGACIALDLLNIDQVTVTRLCEGKGFVQCEHGQFPVPTPAMLELLKGIAWEQTEETHELITPTGAALIAELATYFSELTHLRFEKIGYGAGSRDLASRPNVLRAMLLSDEVKNWETIEVLETNLDDITPEILASVKERLLVNGALDVFSLSVLMKKGRMGVLLTVLSQPENSETLMDLMLTETSAFGVRKTTATRKILRREWRVIKTEWGDIQIKLGYLGDKLVQCAPEYESCKQIADRSGKPVKEIYFLVRHLWEVQGD